MVVIWRACALVSGSRTRRRTSATWRGAAATTFAQIVVNLLLLAMAAAVAVARFGPESFTD
jgi:hypothetical protein